MSKLGAWYRLAKFAWTLACFDALAPKEIDALLPSGWRFAARRVRAISGGAARDGRPGERLAQGLEQLGPAAIKLGQFLSTRGDVFGVTFADDLARLKDRLPPFPTAQARDEVDRALGRPLAAWVQEFADPVAAASLAQVHRARLTDGREVAIKVLRPGIETRVARDVETLRLAAALAETQPAARRLEPQAFASTIARSLELELDLRLEAAAADELGAAMAEGGYMGAPKVVWDGVARRVLTLEWAAGMPLSDASALDQPGLDRAELARVLVRGFLAQALDHGVFHADLHEGNLFVEPPSKLAVVDFGIIGRLGAGERRYLTEILWGFLRRDYSRLADVHFRAGYVSPDQDRGAFAQALRAVGEPVVGRSARDVSMSRLITQLFEITALFEMRLRPELVLLQKTMVVVEGVARRIDPDLDIWTAAEPVVSRWIARELSPAARAREIIAEARATLAALARLAEQRGPQPPADRGDSGLGVWIAFALGAATSALAFALAAWLR